MRSYFVYELKKNAYTLGCITLILTILYLLPLLTMYREDFASFNNLAEISAIGGLLALALPCRIFKYRTTRRSVDLYYALPLSHTKIFITKFLFGLVMVYLPYTVAYWFGALVAIAKAGDVINAVWYVPQYFASVLPIYCIYALTTFAFTRANTAKDGIMFILFWASAAGMVVLVILDLFADYSSFYYPYYFLPYAPLDSATSYFMRKISERVYTEPDYAVMAIGFTLTGLMAAGATVWVMLTEKSAKGENAGQISESWFGYKVMIPFYTVSILSMIPLHSLMYIFVILVIIGAYLLTSYYRRTLKISKNQIIILGASILSGIILSLIFSTF